MIDWKPGDLAVCVDAGPLLINGHLASRRSDLREGDTYKVSAVVVREQPWCNVALRLTGVNHPGYDTARFRKVVDDKREACEPEFVTLLAKIKQPVKLTTGN